MLVREHSPLTRKRARRAAGTRGSRAEELEDVTFVLPDDLLLLLVRCGSAETALSMEAVCGRYLRLLRDEGATLWQSWALARFPVLGSILAAVPGHDMPGYRVLYRLHLELERRGRKARNFETVGLLYSAPMAHLRAPAKPGGAASSLDDYVLTVQILSYDEVLASSSRLASGLIVKHEAGSPSHAVAKLSMPPLWTKQTTPGFLAGQPSWSAEQIGSWDMSRMTARILATRLSDMRPVLLYSGEQYAGSSNESYFTKVVLPSRRAQHSCLAAAVHLTDDVGEVELAILRTIPLVMAQRRRAPQQSDAGSKAGSPLNGRYILESACISDVLRYLESSAPWDATA